MAKLYLDCNVHPSFILMTLDKWIDKKLEEAWDYNVHKLSEEEEKEELFKTRKAHMLKLGKPKIRELIVNAIPSILDEEFDSMFSDNFDMDMQRLIGCKNCEKPIPETMGYSDFCSISCSRASKE